VSSPLPFSRSWSPHEEMRNDPSPHMNSVKTNGSSPFPSFLSLRLLLFSPKDEVLTVVSRFSPSCAHALLIKGSQILPFLKCSLSL